MFFKLFLRQELNKKDDISAEIMVVNTNTTFKLLKLEIDKEFS